MYDGSSTLSRIHDFMRRPVQHLMIVGLHPNADAFVRKPRQPVLLASRRPACFQVEIARLVTPHSTVKRGLLEKIEDEVMQDGGYPSFTFRARGIIGKFNITLRRTFRERNVNDVN